MIAESAVEAALVNAEALPLLAHVRELEAEQANIWDEAIATAESILNRRSGTYEAYIDLLAEPNPYRAQTTEGDTA